MRIIAGEFKGRRCSPPSAKYPTRPTTDIVRESLFNILMNQFDFEQITMLDLFGGFGMNAIEAISRGAKKAVYVERHRGCVAHVKKLSEQLGIEDRLKVQAFDVFKFLSTTEDHFDLIFADPPYQHPKMKSLPDLVLESKVMYPDAWLVIEHDNTVNFDAHQRCFQSKKYGQSHLSFFK